MSVTTKLGVDVSGFTQGINAARASLKTMDAALKQNEAQLRATGDKEAYLQQKTELLSTKMQIQEKVIKDTEKALKRMADAGVKPADAEFQKMQQRLLDAQTGLMNTTTELNTLTAGEQAAAAGADKLGQSMSSIGQKMSLQQVIGGVQSVTGWLESAAKKAVELGQALMGTVLDSASWADDTMTLATVLGLDQDTVQRMNMVAVEFEADAATIGGVWKKLKMNMTSDSADVAGAFEQLGVATKVIAQGKNGPVVQGMRDYQDVFWETGEALMKMAQDGTKAAEVERLAQATLGRSWSELRPLFEAGRESYEEALESQTTVSEDSVKQLAELNDKYNQLQQDWNVLKTQMIGELAPALSKGADALSKMLTSLTEYLQTEEGQQMLEKMGKAVEGLFSNLSTIDPEKVMEGFAGVFDNIVKGLEWLTNNSGTVIEALKAIVIGWAGLKLTGGALKILDLVNGLKGLRGGNIQLPGLESGGSNATTAGETVAKGGLFATLGKAVPIVAGALVWAENAIKHQGKDDLIENGQETALYKKIQGEWAPTEKEGVNYYAGIEGADQWRWDQLLKEDMASVEVTQQQFDAIQKFWDVYRDRSNEDDPDAWMAAFSEFEAAFEGQEDLFDLVNQIMDHFSQTRDESVWPEDLPEDFFKTTVTPQLPDDAQTILQSALDQMSLHAGVQFNPQIPGYEGEGKANGLPFVPYDGYPAILHKGERVVPAREINNSRSFSSNLYVESMIMNNGTDAEGLAAAIAAANQRTMSGFGS